MTKILLDKGRTTALRLPALRLSTFRLSAFRMLTVCLLAACLLVAAGCAGKPGSNAADNAPSDTELMEYNYSNGTGAPTEGTQEAQGQATQTQGSGTQGSSTSSAGASGTAPSSQAGAQAAAPAGALSAQLTADIQPLIDASGMQVGVCIVDLETGERVSLGGGQQMAAASMIKLAIAAAFLQQVEAGAYSLDAAYTLQASDIVGGTGTLGALGAGAQVTYRDLVSRMIDESDNTAANILANAVGMGAVNAAASSMGLSSTQMNRLMMDEAAVAAGIENYTSADDLATILQMIYEGRMVSPQASLLVLEALENQTDNAGLAQGLPGDVWLAHKTGTLATVRHDAGIVECDHPYVVAVMCSGAGFSEHGANALMANIAATAHADIIG